MGAGRAAVLLLFLLSALQHGSAERRVSGEDADLLPGGLASNCAPRSTGPYALSWAASCTLLVNGNIKMQLECRLGLGEEAAGCN